MGVVFRIAWRYLFSKKSVNIVNIIAGISGVGVAIASAALIIILSAFNGIESIIISRFNAFNPEIRASVSKGKYFDINDSLKLQLDKIDNIDRYTFVLENYVAIKKGQITQPFPLKGVDDNFFNICHLDSFLIDGNTLLSNKDINEYYALIGAQVARKMSVGVNGFTPMVLYAPKKSIKVISDPTKAFQKAFLYASGIFAVDESADNKVLVNLSLAQKMFQLEQQASSIEFKLKDIKQEAATQKAIEHTLGKRFIVKNRIQQNAFVKILNSERLIIILILVFVLFLAAFNIVATLTMLIVDKKKDFLSFLSIGLNHFQIKMVFLLNGWLTTLLGALAGVLLGLILVILQLNWGLIHFGNDTANQAYPVILKGQDIAFVFVVVSLIGFLISFLPLNRFIKNYLENTSVN